MAEVTETQRNGWFNHIDVAFTAGTSGLGFDLATPMTDWARLRMGGVFRPFVTYDANFGMEVAEGLTKEEQDERFAKLSETMMSLTGKTPARNIAMEGDMKMNNFKMLVDIFPIKRHRNFHVTVGFYYGDNTLLDARPTHESVRNLAAINLCNSMYKKALGRESLIDFEALGINNDGGAKFEVAEKVLRRWGAHTETSGKGGINAGDVPSEFNKELGIDPTNNKYYAEYGISLPLGTINHDVIAQEDIYYDYSEKLDNPYYVDAGDGHVMVEYRTDANGRMIKKGEIRYRKGEVIYHAGDPLRFVPDENNSVRAVSKTNKFKPYIGMGYSMPITKDKRTSVSVDAGLMFWGGKPNVDISTPIGVDAQGNTVYNTVDLVEDVSNLPSSVEKYIDVAKMFSVFPEISLRISQRIW